ncbi:hypothetical protein HAZT_HAZT007590 [Hyalella azteca]|uniref:Acyl-CoA dehydrogenase/oxidase C-terminal domain-containing protein n=1 Tax=Hyalella azteca TaxID=294128 RepID=A0A6A0GSI1_HYAAZ|nr:hypothetical protein HAZT_HAZT007590 [Hyalella azteca]
MGFLGINFPLEEGGNGGDFLDASIFIEEQFIISSSLISYDVLSTCYILATYDALFTHRAYAQSPGPGFFLHSHIVMPYITRYGTPEQISRYLPDMVAGNKISALAMTEPGAGRSVAVQCQLVPNIAVPVGLLPYNDSCDVQGIKTRAVRDGDDWILNGSKTYITNGLFVTSCSSSRSCRSCHMQERLCAGIFSMAYCEVMFEDTRNFIRDRKAFGKSLTKMQVIQHKMAELKTSICVARAFTDQLIDLHTNKRLDQYTAAMQKYCYVLAVPVVEGYMLEYPISSSYVDVRVQTIYAGTNEIMKELIARPIVA